MVKLYSILFVILLFSMEIEAKTVISHKFLTKSIAKDLKNEIVSTDNYKDENGDNRWRYSSRRQMNQVTSEIQNNVLEIQIPLIWYHERF